MKVELEHQYEAWQDIIESEEANLLSYKELCESAELNQKNLEIKIEKARAKMLSEEIVFEKSFAPLTEELVQFRRELYQKLINFDYQIFLQILQIIRETQEQRINQINELPEIDFDDSNDEQQQGLTFQTIQQFETFLSDELIVGDQCAICMEEIETGRNMMRLGCDGQHTFCKVCIEGWFANHNTCPICRHKF